jgi:hypothetical protein
MLRVSDSNTVSTHGGLFSDEALFEPTYLNWTLSEPPFSAVTVHPCVPRYLGICRTDEHKNGFYNNIGHRSFVTPEIFDRIGEYRFHVEIVGAHVPTTSVVLQVSWNGKWNEIKASLAEDLVKQRSERGPVFLASAEQSS